ncbi:MAG: hypothetical protein RJA36_1227 [Pseudomonadota bacterium]|jgi:hypothetical protein
MNQHIVALLMLFSNMTHAKAPDAVPVAQEPARAAHELKVVAYRDCLAAAKAAQGRKARGAKAGAGAAGCVDPGPYVALSSGTAVPAAPASDKARPAPSRTASRS